jgi:hypothetical protein
MELDDFKKLKGRKAKEGTDHEKKEEDISMITESFKAYQAQIKRKKTVYVAVDIIMAIIYLALVNTRSGPEATGFSLLGAGFAAGALYLHLRYKQLPAGIYSLPVTEFLEKAEKQISYFQLIDYLIVVPLLMLLGTGGGMVFVASLMKYTDNFMLLLVIWILFFILLCVFGYFAGRKNWKKEFGSLYTNIRKMREGIDQELVMDNGD